MNGLDLFSGIGGISEALHPWVTPTAYCERDRYAQATLLDRMANGEIPIAPIWDDVTTLTGKHLPSIDMVFGGFPCQDLSSAGRGAGLEQGSRSGLFFQITRLTNEIRPAFLFLENVPAIRTRGLSRVLSELTALRYDCRWTVISAADVGAPHLRKRWFLLAKNRDTTSVLREAFEWREQNRNYERPQDVAHTGSVTVWQQPGWRQWKAGSKTTVIESDGSDVSDSEGIGSDERTRWIEEPQGTPKDPFSKSWWATEPRIRRVADGVPHRVDRLRCLGNSVVPAQARAGFKILAGIG
jgi:DNA (cytosine-5)-methyltransferase 1